MGMCRACLSTEMKLVPMDQDFVKKFNMLTNLELSLSEDLYTCNTCFDGVLFCIRFREKCILSDITLKDTKPQITEGTTVEYEVNGNKELISMKKEIRPEYDDDDARIEWEYDEDYFKNSDVNDEPVKKNNIRLRNSNKFKIKKVLLPTVSELLCGLCQKRVKGREKLAEHLEDHKMDVACGLCPQRFANRPHMLAHRMEHVPKEQKQCHLCKKRVVSCENLEFHYMRVHEMAEKNALIQCKMCPRSFSTLKKLRAHFVSHRENKYKCNQCDRRFRSSNYLQMHITSHSDKPNFKCDQCDYVCKFSTNFRMHKLRKHTESKVYCKKCKNTFSSQKSMDKHICKISNVVCTICGANVIRRRLKIHMRKHENIKPYECDKCPAKFKYSCFYKTHMDKHDNNPRFQCEYCQRAFFSRSVLVKHWRTHTGEKPYVCDICNKAFTGRNNLKVHMKVHGIMLIKSKSSKEQK